MPASPFESDLSDARLAARAASVEAGADRRASSRGPTTIEGQLVASSAIRAPALRWATACVHQKFGGGTVSLVDGNKLTIDFDNGDSKRVVDSFLAKA